MDIVKESGARELFARDKFCRSLAHSGASQELVDKVCQRVEGEIAHGTTTRELHQRASGYLALEDIRSAARYGLKRGIMDLGPSGFFFEQYIAAVLHAYGYRTRHNIFMQGECAAHEVDVVAEDDATHFLLELKYHNTQTIKTHIDVVMYAWARLQDIAPREEAREHHNGKKHAMWLITNTKFTQVAIEYARCKNIKLTGWNYPNSPHGESLEDMIVKKGLYPVTVLPAVNDYARSEFARHGVMFAKDLVGRSALDLVRDFGIHASVAERIVAEAHELMRQN